jgi:transcriptional regulator with XRE-family HTH domain
MRKFALLCVFFVDRLLQMTANQRIREARKALNMSQKDFAVAICISNTYLADVENDSRKANDRIIKLCSMVFGISEIWLKEGKGDMFYKSPDEKITRLVSIFNKLPLDFQNYALHQLEELLKLRGKKTPN